MLNTWLDRTLQHGPLSLNTARLSNFKRCSSFSAIRVVQGEFYFKRSTKTNLPLYHTHNSHTLLDPARSGEASSLDSTSFGCRHAAFPSIKSPWLDVWHSSQPAGTETQVTEQHPQSRTLELRWLPCNCTKAKVWVLTLTVVMSASLHPGTEADCL